MSKLLRRPGKGEVVTYSLRPHKKGQSPFSDIKLADGTIIRRVDESVHQKALQRVNSAFRKQKLKESA